ncbi:MAG: xylulokinase [Clostridia bacterium]|nr:xylulokinase [Clostridia bacterium]MBT7121495.1 xylulokinase [Clostridia bacterium]
MFMKYIMGIDVGTSGVKCIIIDEQGKVIASDTQGYPLSTPQNGWSEQDPANWWQGTLTAVKNVVDSSGIGNDDIVGLGFSGQMHGLVALDENDNVIRPAILWNDQRTEAECEEIIEVGGGLEGLLSYTNNTMLTGFTGGKILWLKKNEPENYSKMKSFLMPKDYIRFLMTGQKYTDVSDGSGTALFDVENREWSKPIIEKVGFEFSIFPKCLESDEVAGTITKEVAQVTGLKEGMKVYAGGGDAVIQTTGMGIVQEGTIGLIIGTSGVVSMSLDGFGKNEGGKVQFFCNNDKNKWQAFGCQLSSGGSLEWLKDTIYEGNDPFKEINEGAEQSGVGANKLVFLPYLTGERAPHPDPDARGVFFGLSLIHGKGDMARAVMEGVTYGLRQIYELILASKPGIKPTQIFSSGGASKSPLWRQIQADVFGLPVKTLTGAAEGGAYGAAVVAGVGAGLWSDIEQAALMLKEETVTMPIEQNKAKYDKVYEVYSGLYYDLKDRFKQL